MRNADKNHAAQCHRPVIKKKMSDAKSGLK
jgi:hypothetical protein